ncbi:MAG: chromosome segregation protein SMC [Nitriliruptoraceae bacterium]
MFLKSLSLRGFKSFADRTVLEVEPGITVIVGPNGSGKSNVVDALAWVLGTHSAKKVRGGSMSDVIFAGSPTRARAGQARVEIVIDNTDGRLDGGVGTAASAGEFAEIRIARVIQHDGETAYEINGADVRALDVQELLSDTGLGRELHTIVGQGQLDEILNARPEERRRYIEEAAGILKHRRRRERALRKLEQVDAHIDKLRTVLRELRRQLRPLERQAEAADRHAALQAELRHARVSLAAIDLHEVTSRLEEARRSGDDVGTRLAEADEQIEAARAEVAALEQALDRAGQRADDAQAVLHRLTSLSERIRGTADLVEARRRHLVEAVEEPLAGRPPGELRSQAERVEAERDARAEERERDRVALDTAMEGRRDAESARRDHEQKRQLERRRRAEQRERVLRWEGEVSALRGAIATAESELGRVSSSLLSLETRIGEVEREAGTVEEEIQGLDTREVDLTAELEAAEADVDKLTARRDAMRDQIRAVEGERASQTARAEALRAALEESDAGTAALLTSDLEGVLGRVADHVSVAPKASAAVAAALGHIGEAVVVSSTDRARRAVAWLRDVAAGRAVVLAASTRVHEPTELDEESRGELAVAGATPLVDHVRAQADSQHADKVLATLRRWLSDAYLVADWDTAVLLHGRNPNLTFVTADGDVAGPLGYRAGGSPERSAVMTASAAERAEQRADELGATLESLQAEHDDIDGALTTARQRFEEATDQINESDARITGAAERLARLHKELNSLTTQRDVVSAQRVELEQVLERDHSALSELHGRGPDVDAADEPDDGPDEVAIELDDAVERARERELDARVHLERTTEQVRHLETQAAALRQEADEVEAALAEAARRRQLRRVGVERCGELALVARETLEAVDRAIEVARVERESSQVDLVEQRQRLATARDHEQTLSASREGWRERRHEAQLRRAELDSRREALEARLRSELSMTPDDVRAEHPEAAAYQRDQLAEQEDVLVRKIGMLGRVNPLALEEFKALEERHAFLSDQLDDLRRSRRDLEEVVTAVDQRIREVFKAAFDDIATEFELTFSTVFPGGHGRLVLTGDDDLLTAGIDVEARPPGKRVTRLSLLSGGERSLTVLAFVFAIFRARPSPFYVLDEVDAALDDVNLQRLLRVVRSFKGHSQIIMVTHQKRTMEIADVLYGVTMGPDAVTKVVAERLDGPTARAVIEGRGGQSGGADVDGDDADIDAPGAPPRLIEVEP